MTNTEENIKKAGADRRNQVLDAATECFCLHGFHGASISAISKCAGMSAGHIYHYFENKEAIVAAIAERDLSELLDMIAHIQSREDVLQALIDRTPEGVNAKLDRKATALKMEVLAEASRNARIASMLHRIDEITTLRFRELFRSARNGLPPLSDKELNGRCEVLAALFGGLMIRGLSNPCIDREALLAALQPIVKELITG